MVVTLSMPDELYQTYVKMNPANPAKGIVKQLERFQDIQQDRRVVFIYGPDLVEMQRLAGRTVESPEQVVALVKDALSINVGDFKVALTEGQRKRLKQNAHFFGRTPEEYGSEQVKEIVAAKFGV
jgi:hypothetical protein